MSAAKKYPPPYRDDWATFKKQALEAEELQRLYDAYLARKGKPVGRSARGGKIPLFVRVDPIVHRMVAMAAARRGEDMQDLAERAIRRELALIKRSWPPKRVVKKVG